MTYARKVDGNHATIKAAFLEMGASVEDKSALGRDSPDITIGVAGIDQQVEIKSAKGRLTIGQASFVQRWRGRKPVTIRTIDEAIALVVALGEEARKLA